MQKKVAGVLPGRVAVGGGGRGGSSGEGPFPQHRRLLESRGLAQGNSKPVLAWKVPADSPGLLWAPKRTLAWTVPKQHYHHGERGGMQGLKDTQKMLTSMKGEENSQREETAP